MDVVLLDAVALEALEDRLAVEEHGVDEGSGRESHREDVDHGERGREVEGRVGGVADGIERVGRVEDARVVVGLAEAVERARRQNGQVLEGPDL